MPIFLRYKYFLLIAFTILLTSSILHSQIRYKSEIFDNYVKTEDVVYGNAPDLPFIFGFEWNTYDIDLTMDIYEAEGDTATNTMKPATIETGAEVRVPLFIDTGDKIKVDIFKGVYVERIKS